MPEAPKINNNIEDVKSSEIKVDKDDKKCAPHITFENYSCIDLDNLVKMAEAYNQTFKNTQIKFYPNVQILNPGKYKKYLLWQFSNRFDKVCDNQQCWLKQEFMNKMDVDSKNELKELTFRPSGPAGNFDWLNTLDINGVMKQYEAKYKGFKFIGAVPMDFDKFDQWHYDKEGKDFVKLYNEEGINKYGIIYNLDHSNKSGSHWVAGYTDFDKAQVYYYDSYGVQPPPEARELMRKWTRAIIAIKGIKESQVTVEVNKVRQQYGGSECGVFSISFILRLLKGMTFDEIVNSDAKDSEIGKCRQVYFTDKNKKH